MNFPTSQTAILGFAGWLYGTTPDHAVVSPDSKPLTKIVEQSGSGRL